MDNIKDLTIFQPAAPAWLSNRDLAVMGTVLFAGLREARRPATCASLTAALCNRVVSSTALLPAIADDVALEFGVRVDQVGILGYTPRVVAVGFTATAVAGGQVRGVTRPAGDDPVWLLWPCGYEWDSKIANVMGSLGRAVTAMLNRQWAAAVPDLQRAGLASAELAWREQPLVRRALAANLTLAVAYSRGETPRLGGGVR